MLLISHFYNEEYLLPFWLEHHKKIFTYGVLVNNFSDDNSIKLIKNITPDWKIINGPTEYFNSTIMEEFIMEIEVSYNMPKIVLNTTEFLIINNKVKFNNYLKQEKFATFIDTVMMVDTEPKNTDIKNLLKEKDSGIWHKELNIYKLNKKFKFDKNSRSRLLHNYPNGQYLPGRHITLIKNTTKLSPKIAHINWYNFSPWNDKYIERKLNVKNKISEHDKEKNHGHQHFKTKIELENTYNYLKPKARQIKLYGVKNYSKKFLIYLLNFAYSITLENPFFWKIVKYFFPLKLVKNIYKKLN